MATDEWGDVLPNDLVAALQSADDGWVIARAVREPARRGKRRRGGRIVDFELIFLNDAGRRLLGGRPSFTDDRVLSAYVEAVEERKQRTVGLDRLDLRIHPAGDGFVAVFNRPRPPRVAGDDLEERLKIAVDRAAALQDATAALARASTVSDVYEVMTRQVRPLAGWQSLVVMLREDHRLVVSHASGLSATAAANLRDAPLDDPYPMSRVVRDRVPVFYGDDAAYLADFPERAAQLTGAEQRAWAFVPLLSAGRAIGAMAIGYREPRAFDSAERESLSSLGTLYAQAIDRAMYFEKQRSIAADLQHALLPAKLPEIAGARHAVRYLPWTSGADVGGDWYDVIPLDTDSLAVVIGDVAGHSMTAAAPWDSCATRCRRTRSTATRRPPSWTGSTGSWPASTPRRWPPAATSSCTWPRARRPSSSPGTCRRSCAGTATPAPSTCASARRSGLDPEATYLDTTVLVPPGSTLLLYTDGLVEDRRVPIGQGLAELCAAAMEVPGAHPEPARRSRPGRRRRAEAAPRRVALLAIGVDQREGANRQRDEVATIRRFRGDASSAAAARRFAGDVLAAWGLRDLVDTTRLLLGEVITNALQYTVGDVAVRLVLRRSRLRVEVYDASERRPDLREVDPDSESGRGLRIIATLADEWGHDARESGGKVVWFELAV